jgi:hypothetical protein
MTKQRIFVLLSLLPAPAATVVAADQSDPGEQPLTLLNRPQQPGQQPAQPLPQPQQPAQQTALLRDIHGPLPLADASPYLVPTAIAVVLLLALAALFFFLKKRKKPAPPPIPPWEMALLELAEARQFINPGQSLLYMDRAGQILRRYIESRFAIRSTRQTTREFLAGLHGTGSDSPLAGYRAELTACLEQADMAKFAHLVPDREDMTQMEEAVIAFVGRTQPVPPPKGGGS